MIKPLAIIGLLVTSGLVWHQAVKPAQAQVVREKYPILAPCDRNDERYQNLFYADTDFADWPDRYHEQVAAIIDEFLNATNEAECTEANLLPVDPESELGKLAANLPPWADPNDFAKLASNDVGVVLLENLRVYECALAQYHYYLPIEVTKEKFAELSPTLPLAIFSPAFTTADLIATMQERGDAIRQEIATARPTLERALLMVNARSRLSPLGADLLCFQQASLDLRNGLGLTADASQCLPRIWDTRDVLRDL